MIRLLNYSLLTSFLLSLLILIVPLGVTAYDFKIFSDNANGYLSELQTLASPCYKPELTLSIPIVFLIISSIVVGVVWYFWLKLTYTPKKVYHYPVDKKWASKFVIVGSLSCILLVSNFLFAIVGLLADLTFAKASADACINAIKTRELIYIVGIVIGAILSLCIIGYNAYINLMISYKEQTQFVDEQVALGNYDPITRRPKDEVTDVETVKEKKPTDISTSNNENESKDTSYYGSSGLVKDE